MPFMKIGIFTQEEFAFGFYGGFGYVARKTGEILRSLRHQVVFYDISIPSPVKTSKLDNSNVYFLRSYTSPLPGQLGKIVVLKNLLKNANLDLAIHIESSPYVSYLKLIAPNIQSVVWFQDVRVDENWKEIFTLREIYIPYIKSGQLPSYLLRKYSHYRLSMVGIRFQRLSERIGLNGHNLLFSQAKLLKDRVKTAYGIDPVKICDLYNPVFIPAENSIRKSKEPTVIYLGRLDHIKRPWLFGELAKAVPGVKFYFLGISHVPDEMNPIMEKYKRLKNLKFLGLVTGRKKSELLKRAWVMVNTSIYEALPVSFLEALAYKIQILSCQDPDGIVSKFGYYTGSILGSGLAEVNKFAVGLDSLLSRGPSNRCIVKGYQFVREVADKDVFKKKVAKILETAVE